MSGLDMFAWIVLVILVASLGAKRMEMLFGPKTDRIGTITLRRR
jgi:hypothetical protein